MGTGGSEGLGGEGASSEEAVQNAACVSPWIRSEADDCGTNSGASWSRNPRNSGLGRWGDVSGGSLLVSASDFVTFSGMEKQSNDKTCSAEPSFISTSELQHG